MVQVLVIPEWHPTPLNKLIGCGIGKRARLKRGDADLVAIYAHEQGVDRATGPRRVAFTITLRPRERACDPDAYTKSLLDALKTAQLLVDDRRQMVTTDQPEFDRGPRRATTIVLTDLDPPAKPARTTRRKGSDQ